MSNKKVIAITGYGTEEFRKQKLEAGADVYLEKTVDISEFVGEVKAVLDRVCSKEKMVIGR